MLSVALQNVADVLLDEKLIISTAEFAYQEVMVDELTTAVKTESAECTIRVVGREEGQELNHSFRQKGNPTNVLSFAYDDNDPDSSIEYLGDIVLCYPVIKMESDEQGKLLEHHFSHLIVHGVLHLCGYEHEKTAEAEEMEQLEIKILAKLNINNPYLSA